MNKTAGVVPQCTAKCYDLLRGIPENRQKALTYQLWAVYNRPRAKTYAQIRKFNPYHDEKGRFASQNAHTGSARRVQLAPEAVTIQSVARVRAFPCETLSPAQQRQLQNAHKRLLMAAAGQPLGVEVGQVLDLHMTPLTEYVAGSTEGHSVRLPDFQVPYIVIHTHPAGGIFSHGDLDSFVKSKNLKLMTAIGHNGHIYAVEKTGSYKEKEAIRCAAMLRKHIEGLADLGLSDMAFLQKAEDIIFEGIKELNSYGIRFYE